MSTTSTQRTESDAAGGEPPTRRKFPWWLLLVALAVIALVLFLLNRSGGSTDTETTGDQAAQQEGDGEQGGSAGDANPDVRSGKVTAGGATIYPLQDTLTVADFADQQVVGEAVKVESVVSDEGFWIGENAEDRVFVLLTGTGAESAPQVEAGDTIDFEGVVVKHSDGFPDEVGVGADEGAQRLRALQGHIEIPEFSISE